jgi:hypothetical protein
MMPMYRRTVYIPGVTVSALLMLLGRKSSDAADTVIDFLK